MEAFEPPKYITSLIAAVNDGAKSAQLGALAFTAIGLFLLATAFSATDEDLLLNRALTINRERRGSLHKLDVEPHRSYEPNRSQLDA
jgi:hypothetical protein